MSCVGVLSRLHNAVGNLATYICLRQSFVAILFESCRYFLAHVACRNLPWQGLMGVIVLRPAMYKIKYKTAFYLGYAEDLQHGFQMYMAYWCMIIDGMF